MYQSKFGFDIRNFHICFSRQWKHSHFVCVWIFWNCDKFPSKGFQLKKMKNICIKIEITVKLKILKEASKTKAVLLQIGIFSLIHLFAKEILFLKKLETKRNWDHLI